MPGSLQRSFAPSSTPAAAEPADLLQLTQEDILEQLDDVSVYASVAGKSQELEGLPAFVCGENGNYRKSKEGRHGLNTHIFENTDIASFVSYLKALEQDNRYEAICEPWVMQIQMRAVKSDLLQASHHGMIGGTVELYSTVDPAVVLLPATVHVLNEYVYEEECSLWFLENRSGNVKEVIISGYSTVTLPLPYTTSEGTPFLSNEPE